MKINAEPYLQNVGQTHVTVMWLTDEPGDSVVEYHRPARLGWILYDGPPDDAFDRCARDDRLCTVHAVMLDGLEVEWPYVYRVRSRSADGGEATGETGEFRTAVRADSPLSFVSYGDSHRVHQEHRRNAELARSFRPNLCVGLGDLAQDHIGEVVEAFFAPAASLLRYTPWFAAMGNHDAPNEAYHRYFNFRNSLPVCS